MRLEGQQLQQVMTMARIGFEDAVAGPHPCHSKTLFRDYFRSGLESLRQNGYITPDQESALKEKWDAIFDALSQPSNDTIRDCLRVVYGRESVEPNRIDPRLSEVSMIWIEYADSMNRTSVYICPKDQADVLVTAQTKLHIDPGINPHNLNPTTRINTIKVEEFSPDTVAPHGYWWTCPSLEQPPRDGSGDQGAILYKFVQTDIHSFDLKKGKDAEKQVENAQRSDA